jgi:PPM family protein phosphatase
VKPTSQLYIETHTITDPGKRGRRNEDSFKFATYDLEDTEHTLVHLAVVADGVGGHQSGEIASTLAVNSVFEAFEGSDFNDPTWTLKSALLEANHSITSEAIRDDSHLGMGSTIVCALVVDYSLYIATLGDSRIYLIRDHKIRQLTIDHSWVQEAIENGVLTREEARSHPRRHLIRSYLGSTDPIQPDLRLYLDDDENPEQAKANQGLPLIGDDLILLCTDGLTDLVEDQEICEALSSMKHIQNALQYLVDLANERGGHDNITIAVLKIPQESIESPEED